MKPNYLIKLDAKKEFERLLNSDFEDVDLNVDKYKELRSDLIKKYNELESLGNEKYKIDLNYGLFLYEFLNDLYNLDENMLLSSNMSFWYYLSLKVVPNIVYKRWKDSSLESRFYKTNKRVWLFSLWLYIHLSWQGNKEDTYKILENNSTDTIVQVIERAGDGYDINLTRELMKSIYEEKSQSYVRRIMVLNTIYLKTIEPCFYNGGYKGYVNMLIKKARN